jgi:hypothetical protein
MPFGEMATPNVTIDIADFITGSAPANKIGYQVTLTPVTFSAPNARQASTNSSGQATLSAVVPGDYDLQIFGLGVSPRRVTVTDEAGPLDAADLSEADSGARVPSEGNPLIAGENVTITDTEEGIEIAAASAEIEGIEFDATGFATLNGETPGLVAEGADGQYFDFEPEFIKIFGEGGKGATLQPANISIPYKFESDTTIPNTANVARFSNNGTAVFHVGASGEIKLTPMTKVERDALPEVAGTVVYQSDETPGLRVFNGTNWVKFSESND